MIKSTTSPIKSAMPINQVKANLAGMPDTENITRVIIKRIAVPPKFRTFKYFYF